MASLSSHSKDVREVKSKARIDRVVVWSILSEERLIQWAKEGRQPELPLVVASQQPAALDMEVPSQCDMIISHAMTTVVNKACPELVEGLP